MSDRPFHTQTDQFVGPSASYFVMLAFVLLPGAASTSWHWHRVMPILESAGHEVVGVDLPVDDDEAGLDAYREAAVAALGAANTSS